MKKGRVFKDLAEFARVELESGDLEPWAELLSRIRANLPIREEGILWLVTLYNTYDSMGSAWNVYQLWKRPNYWAIDTVPKQARAADFECTQERRNLRGGLVLKRFKSYTDLLYADQVQTQFQWFTDGMGEGSPEVAFLNLERHVRQVWGVGRQASFEWVEFLGKVNDFPVKAPHAELWDSEGPRRSLQSLYDDPEPTKARLEEYANDARDWLASQGVQMTWEDFETVICDFHVMRKGRYYPGRHLAALRGEIEEIQPKRARQQILELFRDMVPAPWGDIHTGIDKSMLPIYRDTGKLALPV